MLAGPRPGRAARGPLPPPGRCRARRGRGRAGAAGEGRAALRGLGLSAEEAEEALRRCTRFFRASKGFAGAHDAPKAVPGNTWWGEVVEATRVGPMVELLTDDLGYSPAEAAQLVGRWPLFLAALRSAAEANLVYLDSLGLREAQVKSVLRKQPSLLSKRVEALQERVAWLEREVGLDLDEVVSVVHRQPQVLYLSCDSMRGRLGFLGELGFGRADRRKLVLRQPQLLFVGMTAVEARLRWLRGRGVDAAGVKKVVALNPGFLLLAADNIEATADWLRRAMALTDAQLRTLLVRQPQLLSRRPEAMQERLDFLRRLGVGREGTGKLVLRYPRILGADVAVMREHVEWLRGKGLPEERVRLMVQRCPSLLVADLAKLEEQLGFLLAYLSPAETLHACAVYPGILVSRPETLARKLAKLKEFGFEGLPAVAAVTYSLERIDGRFSTGRQLGVAFPSNPSSWLACSEEKFYGLMGVGNFVD